MRYATVFAGCLLVMVAGLAALAVEKPPSASVGVEQGPFYDPRTGSYFELRVSNVRRPNWHNTRIEAARLSYEGRRGRLAVVKDLETLNFLREHFRFNDEAWIGLQFFCKFRKLMWITGEIQPLNSPGMWAPRWYRNEDVRCINANIDYMSVYLTKEAVGTVSWQAVGQEKFQKTYIVEYPAPPSEAKESSPAGKETSAK